jgi:hypothetical protein
MDRSHLDVKVRRAQRAAILDLHGEIEGFSKIAMAATRQHNKQADR